MTKAPMDARGRTRRGRTNPANDRHGARLHSPRGQLRATHGNTAQARTGAGRLEPAQLRVSRRRQTSSPWPTTIHKHNTQNNNTKATTNNQTARAPDAPATTDVDHVDAESKPQPRPCTQAERGEEGWMERGARCAHSLAPDCASAARLRRATGTRTRRGPRSASSRAAGQRGGARVRATSRRGTSRG